MQFQIGDLLEHKKGVFSGIGKLVSLDESLNMATVAFFESPIRNMSRPVDVSLDDLEIANIYDEANVYCQDADSGLWRRARYGSRRPNGDHLILFKADESVVVPVLELYILNLAAGSSLNPAEFLEARCNDTPYFTDWRVPFVQSYIEQRAACKSISSILSSSVEIEPHQIAVVRRVLQDNLKKYLLADEVGLGKTIEACLILREHVLQDEEKALVLIAVPYGLMSQWRSELTERFYLGELIDNKIFLCSHEELSGALEIETPTMIVIDEAHQIAPWAWSDRLQQRSEFKIIAQAGAAASTFLLLSGTPLSGNEENFLALLHLLTPKSYELNETGKNEFLKRLAERERLGGMYQAFVTDNDNDTLTDVLDEILALFPFDQELRALADTTRPLVDWMSPDEGEDRALAIEEMRSYIGENYRLHQRMLRNRREDAAIASLFPGLSGATELPWEVEGHLLSIDQTLDAFRDEYCNRNEPSAVVAGTALINWFELYLTSPLMVCERANKLLLSEKATLEEYEIELLEEFVHCGTAEQIAKDEQLTKFLSAYLEENKQAKVVVFCGDLKLANHVFQMLVSVLGSIVERHEPNVDPIFCEEGAIRILVCDEAGEDGLNLHGGEKHIIHYSVPISFTRIEQRNGRLNRYSASIRARPVSSSVLVPNRTGVYSLWVNILSETVRIFERSVASLQFVLQERIEEAWNHVSIEGQQSLEELKEDLAGPNGLLEREMRKVNAQEQLNLMNEEVERAISFASELEEADDKAEQQVERMFAWIKRGLQFQQRPGEVPDSFRFLYSAGAHGPRTLLDVARFIENCITGIDKEKSDYSAPVTALMSPDRQLASQGQQVYPMRYGQPFIDTIYNLTKTDTRGTCSVRLRAVSAFKGDAPRIYFNFFWLVSKSELGCSLRDQRIADELFVPRLCDHWLDEDGELIGDGGLETMLRAPYRKNPTRILDGRQYRDLNVGHDLWPEIEEYFPRSEWGPLVRHIGKKSQEKTRLTISQTSLVDASTLNYQLESVAVVIMIGG